MTERVVKKPRFCHSSAWYLLAWQCTGTNSIPV